MAYRFSSINTFIMMALFVGAVANADSESDCRKLNVNSVKNIAALQAGLKSCVEWSQSPGSNAAADVKAAIAGANTACKAGATSVACRQSATKLAQSLAAEHKKTREKLDELDNGIKNAQQQLADRKARAPIEEELDLQSKEISRLMGEVMKNSNDKDLAAKLKAATQKYEEIKKKLPK